MADLSHNFEGEQQHPPRDEFLLYVDGELPAKEIEKWESHLDACWACRVRVAKIEETITEIIEFENTVSKFQIARSPHNWNNFDSRLNSLVTETGHPSIGIRAVSFWKHLSDLRSAAWPVKIAVPSLAALLIVALIYQFVLVQPVTASELLRLSADAQAAQINKTAQPVVHQRIQVRRTGSETRIDYEIWNDTVNARVRTGSGSDRGLGSSPHEGNALLSDLRSVLIANQMNEHRPLSAASYQSWTDSLKNKTEEVGRSNNALTIHTVSNQPLADGQIIEAQFMVRSADYHPTALYINVKTATGPQEFELIEQSYEVVSLNDVDPAIFADPTTVEVASTVGTKPKTEASESPVETTDDIASGNTNAAAPLNMPKATSAEEVEVLDLLNRVGADITEQLNVTRTADGRLLVEGLVETDKRKNEILNALATVRNNPAIRIKIQTIEEAAKSLARQKAQATPGTVERLEAEKGALAVDPDLREYFGRQGGDVDEHIRRFAGRAIGRSQAAVFQASALNRMANRFNAEQLKELTPESRAKWLSILKRYAVSVRRETAALRNQLGPVFGGFTDGGGESVTSDADLIASARRLYELAAANDHVVRSAFTFSSGGASVSAIKTAQFRLSVAQAEALAAAIERAR